MAYYSKPVKVEYGGTYTINKIDRFTRYTDVLFYNVVNNISDSAFCFVKLANSTTFADNPFINDQYFLIVFKKDGTVIPYNKSEGWGVAIDVQYTWYTHSYRGFSDEDFLAPLYDVGWTGVAQLPEPSTESKYFTPIADDIIQNNQILLNIKNTYGDKVRICGWYVRSNSNFARSNEARYRMDFKDAPIFDNFDDVKKYIDTGKWTPPIHVYYNLFIDGTNQPNISIEWDSSKISVEKADICFNYKALSSNPLIQAVGEFVERVDFKQNKHTISWSNIFQKLDAEVPIIDYFINNKFRINIYISIDEDGERKENDAVGVNVYEKIHEGQMYDELVERSATNDTLTIGRGEGTQDNDDSYNTDDSVDDSHTQTSSYDIGVVNFVSCYKMSVARLNNIASKLWDNSFFDNIALLNNSPIENIVACKMLPINVSGTDSEIKIGNVLMGINGEKLSSTVKKFTIGSISIPRIANYGFLNYSPYTTITIFLPFCGFKELNVNDIMGRTITIDCVIDYISGAIKYIILLGNYQIYEFDGNCGIDIPLSQSNRASVEVGYIQSALGVVGGVATKNPFMIANSIESAVQPYHYQTQGSYAPSTGACEDRTIYLIIDRPKYTNISSFGHVKGYKCQLTKTLKNLSGFVKTTDNVDLSNISAPKYCKDLILDLLSSGIYV